MPRKLFALAAGALAVLFVMSTFDAAEARNYRSGGARAFHGGGHARAFSGRAFRGPRGSYAYRSGGGRFHHRGYGRGFAVGIPLAYGAYYYGSGCDWLRRRAAITGSRYWWNRYQACIDGYDY
jgi:hypothetical protein